MNTPTPTEDRMPDLVERLRATDLFNNRGSDYEPLRIPPSELRLEAAAEIEALRQRVETAEAKYEEVLGEMFTTDDEGESISWEEAHQTQRGLAFHYRKLFRSAEFVCALMAAAAETGRINVDTGEPVTWRQEAAELRGDFLAMKRRAVAAETLLPPPPSEGQGDLDGEGR